MLRPHLLSLVLLPLPLLACAGTKARESPVERVVAAAEGFGERAGLVLVEDSHGDGATRLVYLDQGWGPLETLWYYFADQGSVLLPYDTLVHLERADGEGLLISPESVSRFRLLPQHATPNNPDALPVGFARHEDRVGLTCAACHTSQINYRGTAMRIDGAPALADIMGFLHAIRESLAATLADEAKLARFAAAQQRGRKSADSVAAARKSLGDSLAWFEGYEAANRATTVEGFGRLDAVGRIVNQVIRFTSGTKNSIAPNAPTSFPLLWDAPRHDYVQWTGFSANAGAGALGRNAGEVVGVFGHVDVKHYETEEDARKGYPSTIEQNRIVAMEEALRRLSSPVWPEQILPPIDRPLAARGQALYQTHCASCHALIDRDDPKRKVVAMMMGTDVVGTDDAAARAVVEARIPTGILEGAISPQGARYGADAPALALVGDLATRVVSRRPDAALKAVASAKLHGLEKTTKQGNYPQKSAEAPFAEFMAYKARPLNGVWASAPFLHNGSVPTLHDLLLPPAERPRTFSVGRWEYDPKKVGYVSDGAAPFVVDTSVSGNSNRGHEYGVSLSDDDRWALVEYVKTL
jgi:mono/diheme cytochrome c family protein